MTDRVLYEISTVGLVAVPLMVGAATCAIIAFVTQSSGMLALGLFAFLIVFVISVIFGEGED